ncbi:MAG: hypothetical protein GY940_00250 [bacterium]|nr:hypothetical protein [bacterium]
MVIDKFFIHYKKPAQYLYWGEDYLDLYGSPDTGQNIKKLKTYAGISLSGVTGDQFQSVARDIPAIETGVFLNSQDFIFNIFEFEKLPFQETLKQELVEWRLKKVFPENIADYEHHFYSLSRGRVLSVLFRKSLKETIQQLFTVNDIPLIHIGNSTVEIMNRMSKSKKSAPDFFIEIDKSLSLAVFQENGLPYYIRKFTCDSAESLVGEIVRTINYVKSSYSKTPATYSITADRTHAGLDFLQVRDELGKENLLTLDTQDRETLLFPGKKS